MKELFELCGKDGGKVVIESFGARILLESDSRDSLEMALGRARKALLGRIKILDSSEEANVNHRFGLVRDEDGVWCLIENGRRRNGGGSEFVLFKYFDAILRLRVAENATDWVFIHAGVIAWNGRAVIVPAGSYKGKTTLVAELLRYGAVYYSDEYAVLDRSGLVHPFPRDLTIRGIGNPARQSSIPAGDFGGQVGRRPIPIGVVLLTEYREGAKWDPTELTVGQGIMETIPHTIPLHISTEFSLEVLNKACKGAIIAKSFRGDAGADSPEILRFLDKYLV